MIHLACSPKRIYNGIGAVEELPQIINSFNAESVLIVTDEGLLKAGIVKRVTELVNDCCSNVSVFSETKPEPTISNFENALKLAKDRDVDIVLGLGGGSSIDLAKAVSLFMKHDNNFVDFVGVEKVPSAGLPTVMISTTSGTGSEVSKFAVLTDETTNLKSVIASHYVIPEVAIIDPKLTYSLPPVITAHTGIDALVHAIEGFLARRSSNFTDELALIGLRKIWFNLQDAYQEGDNPKARYEMSLGSMIGGQVLNTTDGAGMVHGLAFSLGVHCKLSHGFSNSLVLPYVLNYLSPYCKEKMVILANTVGIKEASSEETIDKFINEIIGLQKNLGLSTTLKEENIPRNLLEKLAEDSEGMDRLQTNSPKQLNKNEILDIFNKAYEGSLS